MDKETGSHETILNFINSNYECVNSNEDDYLLDNDSTSFISESLASENCRTESTMNEDEIEMNSFVWDRIGFEKAYAMAAADENEDLIWEDIEVENDETDSISIFNSESTEGSIYVVDNVSSKSLTSCVLIDTVDGHIQCCASQTERQRPLTQLVGTWEIDDKVFLKAKEENKLHSLGVCYAHFVFDQKSLHQQHIKKQRSIEKSWISHRPNRNVQVPCVGLKNCSAFPPDESKNISVNDKSDEYRPRYVCSECFNSEGGHFFERNKRGNKIPFSCVNRHNHDATESLKLLGNWILNISESTVDEYKKKLLAHLTTTVLAFDETSCSKKSPSLLYIKVALRLKNINVMKIKNQCYNFTESTSSKIGEALGIKIWRSRNEIRENKKKLEEPDSLEDYQKGFPSFLFEFFKGLIHSLLKKKHEPFNSIIEKNKYTNMNIFGTSNFTDNMLINFEKTFHNLWETQLNNWDENKLFDEITKNIEMGCNVPPPNVVILQPGDNPNCDNDVHNACDMYFNDVGVDKTEHLCIASDEAIFRRLIKYKEKNEKVILFLGQWHTSKDMCSALITIFSGYGIFNLAAKLGVKHLDKLEKVVDYQATCRVLELIWIAVGAAISQYVTCRNMKMSDIENCNNNVLKVWYYYYKWAGYWIGHKIGIRKGNFEMQFKNLSAFSPLFPVAGKKNYAKSVVHFLSYIEDYPSIKELLKHACSVNLTRPGHYFGIDEALERFGVKFVKQYIRGKPMNCEEIKHQISSVQDEKERLSMLISKYVGDTIIIQKDRVTSHKEEMWELSSELQIAFSLDDPKTHILFKDTKEMNEIGFQRLFSCYNEGVLRLNSILRQDVYKTEVKDVKGRGK
ncbi:23703_t:CDS:2, partial [Cetraspora pellucida]